MQRRDLLLTAAAATIAATAERADAGAACETAAQNPHA